jgi:lipid II:glycine glycyltransferase (peptidoglycan interpeptide bridge formation enzyme)
MTECRRDCPPPHEWSVIAYDQVDDWNRRLLQTPASYYQYPYWNEPFRQMWFRPVYLVYGPADAPSAYACLLSFGIPGFRIALLRRGPVILRCEEQPHLQMFASLARWLRKRGYVFLRIDPADPDCAAWLSPAGKIVPCDMFPFLRTPRRSLFVDQFDDDATIASFQATTRRQIRVAERFGYDVRVGDSEEELSRAWPLIEMTAQRKGFRINRSLANWRKIFDFGRPHQCVRVCTVYLQDRPIQAIVMVRDSVSAAYIYGGIDMEALCDKPTSGCLLHWRGMREAHRLGCKIYDLGDKGDENLNIFKNKFRPRQHLWPPSVTLITNRVLFPVWSKVIMGSLMPLWPRIKAVIGRVT